MMSEQFKTIDEAEEYLKSQGVWPVANTCNWTNIEGDDAGIYSIDGYWGEVKAWRIEINRRSDHQHRPDETLPCDSLKPVQGLSRRNVLGALAVLPVALPAAAEAAADPIFAAIEKHRDPSASCDAAVAISASMATDGPDFEAADAVAGQRQQLLTDHANTLIRSEPTTLAGAVALMRHVASIEEWEEPDTVQEWHQVFLNTMARALEKISAVG